MLCPTLPSREEAPMTAMEEGEKMGLRSLMGALSQIGSAGGNRPGRSLPDFEIIGHAADGNGRARRLRGSMGMRNALLHPFLVPLFPVLFLYAHNQAHLRPGRLPLPLLAVLAGASLLLLVLRWWWRDRQAAAVGVSVTGLWAFAFRPFRELFDALVYLAAGRDLPAWIPALLYAALLAGLLHTLRRRRSWVPVLHAGLNGMGLALAAMALWNIGAFEWRQWRAHEAPPVPETTAGAPFAGPRPDIYYVILDSYANEQVLAGLYGFDNGPMTAFLRERGFFVASEARSNYTQTALSLASSLNGDYLDALLRRDHGDEEGRGPLRTLVGESAVFRKLEGMGYAVIPFESHYDAIDLHDRARYRPLARGPGAFAGHLLGQTPLSLLFTPDDAVEEFRQTVLDAFDRLERMPAGGPPFLVFAHLLPPHPPFVFAADGTRPPGRTSVSLTDGSQLGMRPEEYRRRYLEQVAFVNGRLRRLVDAVLARPGREAVIILQADHGPGSELDHERMEGTNLEERFAILLAVRLPGGAAGPFSPGMTPVNLFRAVFAATFGEPFVPLEDRGYFASWTHPYRLRRAY